MTAARVGTVPLGGGAQPTFVQKDVLHGGEPIQIAPNGRELAFSAFDFGGPNVHISVAALDQSSFRTFLDVPAVDYGGIAYLAPDGRELVYLARSSNLHTHDIRALDVTTGKTRAIVQTSPGNDIFGNVSVAPDGKHIAYALQSAAGMISVHVVGTNGRVDRVVGPAPGAIFEASPQWDPQGRRLLIERDDGGGAVHPVIVDLGGGPDVVVDAEISENGAGKAWAPDGTSILAQRTDGAGRQLQQEVWDARTGKVTPVAWPSVTPPSWQRVAP
jgi:Tol biopolymer transport system component